jgi:hypothetical protein
MVLNAPMRRACWLISVFLPSASGSVPAHVRGVDPVLCVWSVRTRRLVVFPAHDFLLSLVPLPFSRQLLHCCSRRRPAQRDGPHATRRCPGMMVRRLPCSSLNRSLPSCPNRADTFSLHGPALCAEKFALGMPQAFNLWRALRGGCSGSSRVGPGRTAVGARAKGAGPSMTSGSNAEVPRDEMMVQVWDPGTAIQTP